MNLLRKLYDFITKPAPIQQRVLLEFQQAESSLLESKSALEFAEAMVSYNTKRVERLKKFLQETIAP